MFSSHRARAIVGIQYFDPKDALTKPREAQPRGAVAGGGLGSHERILGRLPPAFKTGRPDAKPLASGQIVTLARLGSRGPVAWSRDPRIRLKERSFGDQAAADSADRVGLDPGPILDR